MKGNFLQKKISFFAGGIIFIIIGIICAAPTIRDCIGFNGELKELNEATVSDLKDGDYVSLDVNYAYYPFCENIETTSFVIKRTTHQFYLIDSLENDYYFMGLKISNYETTDLEDLSDYTFFVSDTNPGPLHYVGKLEKADDEIYGYMQDYIYDMYEYMYGSTLSDDDKSLLDSYMVPYYVEVYDSSDYPLYIGLGVIFVIMGFISIYIGEKNKRKKQNVVVISEPTITPYDDISTNSYGGDANTYGSFDYNDNYSDLYGNSDSSSSNSIPYTPKSYNSDEEN